MRILAAFFAALTIILTTAVATASADEPRNFYCGFLEDYNPDQFAAYAPCNW
jgi:hypothetical protein